MVGKYTLVEYFYQNGYVENADSQNFSEIFHNLVIDLINNESYEKLVSVCYAVYSFDPNNSLIPKIIFTLVNLHANKNVVDICEMYLKQNPDGQIFYEVIDEFLKYDNYSGAIDLCLMYLNINPNGNIGFVRTVILGYLKNGKEYMKVLELIKALLKFKNGNRYILPIVNSMIDDQNYKAVVDICRLILNTNLKNPEKVIEIAYILLDNGKTIKAYKICKILLKLFPDNLEISILHGSILTKKDHFDKALEKFNSALRCVSNNDIGWKSKILNLIGNVYLKKNDLKNATNYCIKSMKLNPKFPQVFNNLGCIYHKKEYIEKAVKLIKRGLKLKRDFCSAWCNLGQIYLEMKNYYEAFKACYKCLSFNNQYHEGLKLYTKLTENPDLKLLSYLIPQMIRLGYRCGFDQLNEKIFPSELLRRHNYITYSEEFLNFLKGIRLAQMYLDDFVSIYCCLPKCMDCELLLRLYGERIDYKTNCKIKMYRCEKCGKEKKEVLLIKDEDISLLKIRVILKRPLINSDGSPLIYSKLDYEKIFITYTHLDMILNQNKNNKIEFFNNLENSILLCGKEIRLDLI